MRGGDLRRGERAWKRHGERGCARRGVRGPRAHQPDLARRVPHMRSATGCSAPEGPAPLRLRRAVPRPGAHAAPRGDSRPPHNSQLTTPDSPPSTRHPSKWPPLRTDSPICPSVRRVDPGEDNSPKGRGQVGLVVSVCVVPPWDSLTSTRERAALAEPPVVGETRSTTLLVADASGCAGGDR